MIMIKRLKHITIAFSGVQAFFREGDEMRVKGSDAVLSVVSIYEIFGTIRIKFSSGRVLTYKRATYSYENMDIIPIV